MADKSLLRKKYKYQRNQLPLKSVANNSHIISRKVIASDAFKQAKTIVAYMSIFNEVSVLEVMKAAWEQGKEVAVPKVIQGELIFYIINSIQETELGYFNILEPTSSTVYVPKDNDLILVPGIAFDKSGKRIGYGGGFYDRYLAMYKEINLVKMGICHSCQLVETVPVNSHDESVDYVITEL